MDSSIGKLSDDLHGLLYKIERYLRLEATEKLTVISSCIIVGAIIFALATSAIFFLSTGVVKSLTLLTGSEIMSYYIVSGVLIIAVVVVYVMRKRLVERRMAALLSRSILEGETFTEWYAGKPSQNSDLQVLAKSLIDEVEDYDEEGGDE